MNKIAKKGLPVSSFPVGSLYLRVFGMKKPRPLKVFEKVGEELYCAYRRPRPSARSLPAGERGFQVAARSYEELSQEHQFLTVIDGEDVQVKLENLYKKTKDGRALSLNPALGVPALLRDFDPDQQVIDLGIAGIKIIHYPALTIEQAG